MAPASSHAQSAPVSAPASEKARWLYTIPGVIAVVLAYSALHLGARLIASSNLGEDDPLDAILTQTLEWGYSTRQPPLYDWLLWLIEQATGPGALSFQLLKYGLLTATCAFLFAAARRAMQGDVFWAFLSVESLALIYQISWRFHEGFTHAVGAMCAVAAALWAMLRLVERQRLGDYALFGLIAGLGLLTVTPFWVFLPALIIAAALQRTGRAAIARPAMLLSAAVAALAASPYFLWLAGTPEGLGAVLPSLNIGGPDYWTGVLSGLRRAVTEPVMYLAPLIFLVPLFFPATLAAIAGTVRLKPQAGPQLDAEQLILHLTLLNIAALIPGALFFGVTRYPVHALMPLFLVTTIWIMAQARKGARNPGEVRRFVVMALAVAVFAFAARCANMFVMEPVCSICRWGIPYAGLADGMKARGFEGGQLIVYDDELGGNLRRFFPEAQILLAGPRRYLPPEKPASAGTALVWKAAASQDKVLKAMHSVRPQVSAETLGGAETLTVPWRGHLWKPDGYRASQWRFLILERR